MLEPPTISTRSCTPHPTPTHLSLKFGRVSKYAHLPNLFALIAGVVECDLPADTTCCNGQGTFSALSVLMTAFVQGVSPVTNVAQTGGGVKLFEISERLASMGT